MLLKIMLFYSPEFTFDFTKFNFICLLMFQIILQIYDPTKKWERYTIHGD